MKVNVGSADQKIRLLVGIVLMSFLFLLEGNVKYIGLIGLIPIVTVFLKFCPIYVLFGVDTCNLKK